MTINKNYQGVLIGETPRDFKLGSQVEQELDVEDWSNFLSEHERQNDNFETYACTVFSGNDVKEAIMMYALKNNLIPKESVNWLTNSGYFNKGFINFDDRIPAMHAEINPGVGTYQWKAANALTNWSLPEGILGDDPKSWEKYYSKNELSDETKLLQMEYDRRFIWHWYWFDETNGNVDEQLKNSPAMSVVRFANGEECLKPDGQLNHAVMEYGRTDEGCRRVEDNYEQRFKNYNKGYIMYRLGFKLTIINKNNMDVDTFLKENDLKTIWNRDTGAYYYVLQKALRPFKTSDRSVLLLVEKNFREDGKITISKEQAKQLPIIDF